VVIRPAGIEHPVTDSLAIDIKLIVTQSADINCGPVGRARAGKFLSQIDGFVLKIRRLFLAKKNCLLAAKTFWLRLGNPAGLKFCTAHKTSRQRETITVGTDLSGRVPPADAPVIFLATQQFLSIIGDAAAGV